MHVYIVNEIVDLGSHIVSVWTSESKASEERDALQGAYRDKMIAAFPLEEEPYVKTKYFVAKHQCDVRPEAVRPLAGKKQ